MLNSYKKLQRWYGSLEPRPAGDDIAHDDGCDCEASATAAAAAGKDASQGSEWPEAPTHSETPVECPGYRAPQRFEPPRPADFTGAWTDWLSEQDIPEYGGEVVPFPGPRGDARSETRGLPAGLRTVLGVVLGAGALAGCLARVGVVG